METIDISIHIANIPCTEEFYMGISPEYKAYTISIPKDLVPKEVLKAMDRNNLNKRIQGIALFDTKDN